MAFAARVGDSMTHGAVILSGSPDVMINGLPAARIGDTVSCPIHGLNNIISGCSPSVADDGGLYVARIGAQSTCGAVVISASPNVDVG